MRPDRPGPRAARALPWAAIAVMSWLALFPITSVDAYYHLAVGRWMLEHREIPDRAVFSATFGDRPWHDNEWGFQVLAAAVGRAERSADGVLELTTLGRVGLIGLRAAALGLTLALLSAAMSRAGVDPVSRAVALVAISFLTFNNLFWTVRPQILTYAGLAGLVWILARDREGRSPWSIAALPLIAVWANVHGAFIVAVVLLGAETIGSLLDRDGRFRRLAVVTALAPLAACLNPHGWNQVVHPFLYVLRPEIHAGNAEWTRPDLVHLPLLLLTTAWTAVALRASDRRRWADILRALAFLGLFSTAIRHLPLVAIVLVPIGYEAGARAARLGGWRANVLPTATTSRSPALRLGTAAVLILAIVGLSGARFVGIVPSFVERPVRPMPESAVREIARSGIEGNVFNAYRMGGFLMFRLYPAERVVMDGRNDVYGRFRDQVYNPVVRADPGWRAMFDELVEEHAVDWVLLDPEAAVIRPLRADPDWIERATPDTGTVLFVRAAASRSVDRRAADAVP